MHIKISGYLLLVKLFCVWVTASTIETANDISPHAFGTNSFIEEDELQQWQSNEKTEYVREFNCGRLYYRTFYLDNDNNFLYVGAMDKLFRLNLSNINQTDCEKDSLLLEASDPNLCILKGQPEGYQCRNHIRTIHSVGNGEKLYICGTNAHSPKEIFIYNNLTHLPRHEYIPNYGKGQAKCPFDANSNSTSLWVEHGNPGDIPALYSGTQADFNLGDDIIFRMPLYNKADNKLAYDHVRTARYDSKWLGVSHFVGSFEVGNYVYFFFRENAFEYLDFGKKVFSRVARVCKSDTGGHAALLRNVWTTFVKARLNCSIHGDPPFYFNEIQHIYRLPGDNETFYGVFTTPSNGLIGSAVCTFKLSDIQSVFKGKFKEKSSSTSAWLTVSSNKVPVPRPGECYSNVTKPSEDVLKFVRDHNLMAQSVDNEFSDPIFFEKDVVFVKLVVDQVRVPHSGLCNVYYIGTDHGKLYKIVQWFSKNKSKSSSALLDALELTDGEPIRAMELSQQFKSLYVSSDNTIKQINLIMCARRYDSCLRCVRDPYCGWHAESNSCKQYSPGLLQDVSNSSFGICDNSIVKKKITVTWGQSVHLTCFKKVPETMLSRKIQWYHVRDKMHRHPIDYEDPARKKYLETRDYGLVILALNEADAGRYDCMVDNSYLCSYNLTVDLNRCTAPSKSVDYQRVYSNWCHEFEKYKSALKIWEKKQAKCMYKQNNSDQNSHTNEISSSFN